MKMLKIYVEDIVVPFIDGKLEPLYKHLEKPKSHVRLLFADFSSAFNKMQPHILIERLASYFKLPDQLLVLLLDFLTDRIQQVLVNGHIKNTKVSNTGSPMGCILSPLLFIMYTHTCRASQEGSCGGCMWSVCCWWLVYSLTWPESDWLDSGWVGLHTCGAEQSWHRG